MVEAIDEETRWSQCRTSRSAVPTCRTWRRLRGERMRWARWCAWTCTNRRGCLPVDVRALGVEFATGGSVKWLCGGPGAGYLYVRRDCGTS